MAVVKLPAPSAYTLPALARAWDVHPDVIRVWADDGLLGLATRTIDGTEVPVVTHDEKIRFEGLAQSAEARPMNPSERRSYLNLLAVSLRVSYADDVREPYKLAAAMMADAQI